jgi:hypothetical protein
VGYAPLRMTTDATNLYWTDQLGGPPCYCSKSKHTTIMKVPVGGGVVSTLATIPYEARPYVASDATSIYVAADGPFNPSLSGPSGSGGGCNGQGENCGGNYAGLVVKGRQDDGQRGDGRLLRADHDRPDGVQVPRERDGQDRRELHPRLLQWRRERLRAEPLPRGQGRRRCPA